MAHRFNGSRVEPFQYLGKLIRMPVASERRSNATAPAVTLTDWALTSERFFDLSPDGRTSIPVLKRDGNDLGPLEIGKPVNHRPIGC